MHRWKSLLDHENAKAALASIHEIATALEANLKDQGQATASVGAAQDAAGIATFFAYLQAASRIPSPSDATLCALPRQPQVQMFQIE